MRTRKTIASPQCCDECGDKIQKSKNPEYTIDDSGNLICDSCKKERREAAMADTFKQPMREGK